MPIPVSLADGRRQLRLEETDTSRDTELSDFITDAAAWVEKYTGHILVARDVTEYFSSFDRLALAAWPIKPNAVPAVSYDVLGTSTAVTGAQMAPGSSRPAFAQPAFGTSWPVRGAARISVTIRAGYEPEDIIPGNFKRAMLILITAYDEDREGGDLFANAEKAARRLCGGYRLISL